jgi:hypothetical protein
MPRSQTINCPSCHAPIAGKLTTSLATCKFCGTSFQTNVAQPVSVATGDILLSADFRSASIPGWSLHNQDKTSLKAGELWATFPASNLIYPVISTPGFYDDCDISATFRFVEGSYEHIYAGIETRWSDDGNYNFYISAQGTYRVAWHNKREWGGELMGWTTHPALHKEMGVPNRLRIVQQGERIRVFINGVLATSLSDTKFKLGRIRIVIAPPTTASGITVAYSDVQLREVG